MKKCYLTLAACLLSALAICQPSEPFNRFSLKITPTAVFNPNLACILTGLEFQPSARLGIQLEYGFKFQPLSLFNWHSDKHDWHYQKLKTALRWHFLKAEEVRLFAGLEGFYFPQRYVKTDDYFQAESGVYYQYEKSAITKNAWGLCLSGGLGYDFGKHFFIEIYGGLGVKLLSIRHRMTNAVEIVSPPFQEWTPAEKDTRQGKWVLPYVDCGLKIGYAFGQARSSGKPPSEN